MKNIINTMIAVGILILVGCAHKQVQHTDGKSVVTKNIVK